jgi:PPM family protein phosphatase
VIELRAAGVTDAGRVRTANQDRFLIVADRMYVVADGMGGHRGGEVAAQMTVEALGTNTDSIQSTSDLVTRLERTNQTVLDRSNEDPELRGMGTTVTALALFTPNAKNPVVSIINVGDSRTYRMRAGELEQLTEDHSVVAELMRTGRLSPEEARGHRQRSVLTRAIGVEPSLETDTLEVLVNQGDRFLLCSDGLYSEVTDLRIAAVLRQLGEPHDAAKELVRLALQNGGRDNITVLIIDAFDDRDPSYVASKTLLRETTFGGTPVEFYEPLVKAKERTTKPDLGELSELDAPKRIKGAARKPWAVNLRVLLFVGLLAALGAVVAWVVTAGKGIPSDRRIPTADRATTSSETVPGSTVVGGAVIPVLTLPNGDQLGATISGADSPPSVSAGGSNGDAVSNGSTTGTAVGASGNRFTGTSVVEGVVLGVDTSLVPTTLDPFDPAPKVKEKRQAKTKNRKNVKKSATKKPRATSPKRLVPTKPVANKVVTKKVAPKPIATKKASARKSVSQSLQANAVAMQHPSDNQHTKGVTL